MGGAPIMRPLLFFFATPIFSTTKKMGKVPIEFVLFSAYSQHIVLAKILEMGFLEVMGEAPIFRPSFFFFETPIFSKKNHGRCAHDAPTSFFFSAHDPYIPSNNSDCGRKRKIRFQKSYLSILHYSKIYKLLYIFVKRNL